MGLEDETIIAYLSVDATDEFIYALYLVKRWDGQ